MKQFRKIIFWLHLTSGIVAGIVIFIMSVTGALLAFEKNIIEFAEREMRVIAAPSENARRLPIGEIIARVREAKSDSNPSNITLQNEADAAALVALGGGRQIFVNPYTGEITGEGAKGVRGFFRTMTDLHRWLALSGDGRAVGKAITGACNLAFLFLAISGFYIWFPRRWNWRHFRAVMILRWKVKGKARDFNWHTVIGFWSSLVLIVLTVTAAVISYTWASNLVYTLTGSEPPRQQQRPQNAESAAKESFIIPENIAALWQRAEQQAPTWKSISLRLPVQDDFPAAFTIDEGNSWNVFGRSQLTLDAKTAEVVKWEPYLEQNAGRQLRSWLRFTHTGESFGIVGQFIAFLACVGGAFLVWTGFSLVWRRFRNWRTKRSSESLPVS
jgi:uncharacterized iron-regulated membrane protein